jgi:hypothetical protein
VAHRSPQGSSVPRTFLGLETVPEGEDSLECCHCSCFESDSTLGPYHGMSTSLEKGRIGLKHQKSHLSRTVKLR